MDCNCTHCKLDRILMEIAELRKEVSAISTKVDQLILMHEKIVGIKVVPDPPVPHS